MHATLNVRTAPTPLDRSRAQTPVTKPVPEQRQARMHKAVPQQVETEPRYDFVGIAG